MKLGTIIHKEVQRDEAQFLKTELGMSEMVHVFHMASGKRYDNLFFPASTFQPGVDWQVAVRPSRLLGVKAVYMDVGNTPTTFKRASDCACYLLERFPEMPIGIMVNHDHILAGRQELAEIFNGKMFFPVSIMGNGEQPIEMLLEQFAQNYKIPFRVPCVLAMNLMDRAALGNILSRYWEVFPKLLFWSPLTLVGINVQEVGAQLANLRARDDQKFICVRETVIRESPSLNARAMAHAKKGDQLVVIETVGNSTLFGKLESGGFVVLDDTYLHKQ